jgi:hypothetical protein
VASLPRSKPVVKLSLSISINGQPYGVERIDAAGFGTVAFRLAGPQGQIYDVICTHFGIIECDCPRYEMRLKGNCITKCKH